jgi:hypothetical protein
VDPFATLTAGDCARTRLRLNEAGVPMLLGELVEFVHVQLNAEARAGRDLLEPSSKLNGG